MSWARLSMHSSLSKKYFTEPQIGAGNKQLKYPQGIGIGGSTNINAMLFSMGHPNLFNNHWPANWNSDIITKDIDRIISNTDYIVSVASSSGIFKQMVNSAYQDIPANNNDTTQSTFSRYNNLLYWDLPNRNKDDCFFRPAHLCSLSSRNTLLDIRSTSKDIIRVSPHEPLVTIMRSCKVIKVIFEGTKATGVEIHDLNCFSDCSFRHHGRSGGSSEKNLCRCGVVSVSGGGEVILCAGTFETPRILIASGLGLRNESNSASDISPSMLPQIAAIGKNLQDHCILPLLLACNWWVDWNVFTSMQGVHLEKYPVNCVHGWINLNSLGHVITDDDTLPTVQLLLCDGRFSPGVLEELLLPRWTSSKMYTEVFRPLLAIAVNWLSRLWVVRWLSSGLMLIAVCCVGPHSRGSVSVDPKNPQGPLHIDPGYLTDARDKESMRLGLLTARQLVDSAKRSNTPNSSITIGVSGRRWWSLELLPGPFFTTEKDSWLFKLYTQLFLTTYFHASGSCAMKTTNDAATAMTNNNGCYGAEDGVVDSRLCVWGVSGLRVADASVMPRISTAPTVATCLAVGAAAGRFIVEDGQK
mmetsp:Transcript_25421/g.34969  ORF Transcript_25421/g.34969 Transcript_25421/m.34969 type:complete len:583 (-) Transcript_25421:189-1937(-)